MVTNLLATTGCIPVVSKIDIDLTKAFTMQGLFESIQLAYPKDPSLRMLGISIPVLNLQDKEFGIFHPVSDIKAAIARLYDYCTTAIIRPIWDMLYALFNLLKRFGLPELDLKLPVFDLHISDLFAPDLYDRLKVAVLELYTTNKAALDKVLSALNIPNSLYVNIVSPEKEIDSLIKHIMSSLMDSLFKLIAKVIGYIKKGLLAWDILKGGLPIPLTPIWTAAVDLILGKILAFLTLPPSIQDIYDAVMIYAKNQYNRIPTYEEILSIIEQFKLPVFGFPLDWKLPIDPTVNIPNVDFIQILGDMKLWMNNFLISLLQKFIQEIAKILKAFGLSFVLPRLSIPFIMCAISTS